jgi:hypothetical protein
MMAPPMGPPQVTPFWGEITEMTQILFAWSVSVTVAMMIVLASVEE